MAHAPFAFGIQSDPLDGVVLKASACHTCEISSTAIINCMLDLMLGWSCRFQSESLHAVAMVLGFDLACQDDSVNT